MFSSKQLGIPGTPSRTLLENILEPSSSDKSGKQHHIISDHQLAGGIAQSRVRLRGKHSSHNAQHCAMDLGLRALNVRIKHLRAPYLSCPTWVLGDLLWANYWVHAVWHKSYIVILS